MKTAKEKAENWINANVVLAEYAGIEYSDLIKKLEVLLKDQDRDTRHACAEAFTKMGTDDDVCFVHIDNAHDTAMNVKAV